MTKGLPQTCQPVKQSLSPRLSTSLGSARRPWLMTALLIVACALIALAGVIHRGGGKTAVAFASAPPGDYVIFAHADIHEDIIYAARADRLDSAIEIGRLAHLPQQAIRGSVSPDGKWLAAIVAVEGQPSNPRAALILLDLAAGTTTRLATDVDLLQTPAWNADSSGVLFSRSTRLVPGDEAGLVGVTVAVASVDSGAERAVATADDVLGAYPVGFDAGGAAISIVIDGKGSSIWRDATPLLSISSQITRDWKLSPDGRQLAFIESNVQNGLRYLPKLVALDGSTSTSGAGSVLAASAGGQSLGVAWDPRASGATFGRDGGAVVPVGGVLSQSVGGSGFDVPLGFAPRASALAVQHWSGPNYTAPGQMEFQLVGPNGRATLADATRYFGWAAR